MTDIASSPGPGFDARLPPEMAAKAENAGVEKAGRDWMSLLALAVLAGAFIALGAMFSTTVLAGAEGALPYGVARLLAGLAFSLGLVLVVVGGAELFTGDNLMVMAWAAGRITWRALLRVWALVYLGNLAGAIGVALVVFLSGQYAAGHGAVAKVVLKTALDKSSLPFVPALFLGLLCNLLVCLAVWLSFSARSTTDKVMAVILPVAAFVAAGFEHCVANMYLIPLGLFVKAGAGPELWTAVGRTPADYAGLTWAAFAQSLVPVTLGNVIGGAGFVGGVYWFIYLRPRGRG